MMPILWDRVHIMVDITDDTKPNIPRRIEVMTGAERHRRWPNHVKARIVAESFAPGAVIAEVARRHDLRGQQIHAWRKAAREGRIALPAQEALEFAAVMISPSSPPPSKPKAGPPRANSNQSPMIEIEAEGILVRVRNGACSEIIEVMLRTLRAPR
jgi:transposase